ncbi:MAG: FMN-binding negative transcriptional regulator [Xanthomonadales bacterium]|nr:FMN-binding negative transcriptional regulator [Xanthomonadales bacterium]
MHLPARFRVDDLAALDALVERDAFATLVSVVDGAPFASHLPVLYRREGGRVRFSGHWARANRQWRNIEGQQVLLIVHGAHAYVSPTWYADPAGSVPTWNYAVAHVRGLASTVHDQAALTALVAALAAKYEAALGSAWRFPEAAPDTVRELAGIVGFELEAESIEIKHKLNQHHDRTSVEGAIAGLHDRDDPGSVEIAAMMASALAARDAAHG